MVRPVGVAAANTRQRHDDDSDDDGGELLVVAQRLSSLLRIVLVNGGLEINRTLRRHAGIICNTLCGIVSIRHFYLLFFFKHFLTS